MSTYPEADCTDDYSTLVHDLTMYSHSFLGRHHHSNGGQKRGIELDEKLIRGQNYPPVLLFLLNARSALGEMRAVCLVLPFSSYKTMRLPSLNINDFENFANPRVIATALCRFRIQYQLHSTETPS